MTAAPRTPRVSIIIPCRNEARYIGPCLDSIVATAYPEDRMEVLVVDGRSTDATRDTIARYVAAHDWIHLLDNPDGTVPAALNRGITQARGDVIVRMDAHVVYPPTYLPRLVAELEESKADNVGGCIITLPADETPVARAIAIALAHPFGVGNSYFRVGAAAARWVDTVPFGCFRRDVFRRVGLFDEELVRNQDDEFNFRLIRRGGRVRLVPDVVAYYYARASWRQVARMYYQYGYFKPLVARKVGRVMTLRQLAPAAFVTALALSGIAALALPASWPLLAGVAGSYAAVALACAVPVVRRAGLRCALALLATFPTLHIAYGIGFLRGAWDAVLGRRRAPADARAVPLSR